MRAIASNVTSHLSRSRDHKTISDSKGIIIIVLSPRVTSHPLQPRLSSLFLFSIFLKDKKKTDRLDICQCFIVLRIRTRYCPVYQSLSKASIARGLSRKKAPPRFNVYPHHDKRPKIRIVKRATQIRTTRVRLAQARVYGAL